MALKMMVHDLNDLVGLSEIADVLGLSGSSVVKNWVDRYKDFPRPLLRISNVPIYSLEEVVAWHRRKWPNSQVTFTPAIPIAMRVGEQPPVLDAEVTFTPTGEAIRIILPKDKWLPPGDYTVRRIN